MTRRSAAITVATVVLMSACAGQGALEPVGAPTNNSGTAAPPTTAPTTTTTPPTTAPTSTTTTPTSTTTDPDAIRAAAWLRARIAEAASFTQAEADMLLPDDLDPSAGGAPGYTRYVFRETSGGVVPTLLEGPLGPQTRCQDPELPCSYDDLVALRASGDPIPAALGLATDQLSALVSELDQLAAFAALHADADTACAEGFVSDSIQTPNMGSHFINLSTMNDGFDPGQPQILLYALADDQLPSGAIGQCRGGIWDGDPLQLVGTAFLLSPYTIGLEHPDGFSGNLDNWHTHFNLCRGNSKGSDNFVTEEECRGVGGTFHDSIGWMLHAWVDPEHDNQLGVFSMWNSSITPFLGEKSMRAAAMVQGSDFPENARQTLISDFAFEAEIEVDIGTSVYFNNSDSVPHTISAGTPDAPDLESFDSGLLDPGDNWELDTSTAGNYTFFCALHPDMTATIVVG